MNRIRLTATCLLLMISFCSNAQFTDSIDQDFGVDGISLKTFETDFTPIELAVLQNDQLLVLGRANFGNSFFTIAKFDANGQSLVPGYGLFNGFSQFGTSSGGIPTGLRATDMLLLEDESVIISGSSFNIITSKFELFAMKLTPQGLIDTQFGTNGITNFPVFSVLNSPIHGYGTDIAKGQNGEFFVSGKIEESFLAIVKFNANGQVANSFGDNGLVKVEHRIPNATRGSEVELFSDGRILVSADIETYPNGFQFPEDQPAFYAFLPNGDLDPDFIQGVRTLSRNVILGIDNQITIEYEDYFQGKLVVNADDKAFLSGAVRDLDAVSTDFNTYLISILSNGEYNTEIGVNPDFDTLAADFRISVPGMILLSTNFTQDESSTSMLLLNDGTMILAGHEYGTDGISGTIRHVDNTGNPFVDFANQGVFKYQQQLNSLNEGFLATAIQSNGEVVFLSPYKDDQNKLGMYMIRLGETGASSSTENLNTVDKLLVFPNPSTADVFVKTHQNQTLSGLKLFDLSGRLVSVSANNHSFNLMNLDKGVYIIEAHVDDIKIRKRVIHN